MIKTEISQFPKFQTIDYFKFVALLILLYMPLFSYLDSMTIRLWDESRLAVNAFEMLKNNNYLVTYFGGQPDLWNTKPPLMIWAQVFFIRLLGVNELAVRLPSALAALFTCLAIVFFSLRYFQSFWPGCIAALVLITTDAYVGEHVARTGDYDALLILFTTLAGLMFFSFTETRKPLFLYLFFLMMSLGVLTKGIAPMIFTPAFLLYLLIRRQFVSVLKNRHFYIGSIGFLLLSVSYYLIREAYYPGYISAVYLNEIGGRYLETLSGDNAGFWIYFTNLKDISMPYWVWFIVPGLVVGLFTGKDKIKRLTLYSFLLALVFILVISYSETKFNWYIAPSLPFLAIIISVLLWKIMLYLNSISIKHIKYNFLPLVFLVLFLFKPYKDILAKTNRPYEDSRGMEFNAMSYVLKDAHRNRIDVNGYYVVYEGYRADLLFYIYILNDQGVNIGGKLYKDLVPGDKVIVCQLENKAMIDELYQYHVLNQVRSVYFLEIVSTNN